VLPGGLVPGELGRACEPARDAFLYLVLFATLYTSAYHLAQLFFQIIEARLLPDESGSLGAEGQGARARRDA